MADLLSWLGSGLDKIIPGDQSFLHPQKPQPISDTSRMAAANIGRGVGYGNTNSTQPYSAPMPQATPQSLGVPMPRLQPQMPQQPSFGSKALGVAGNVGNMLLGDVNHLSKVISYPINTAQYQDMARKGQITQAQAAQLINQAGDEAGFNIEDKNGTVLRKVAGAVAMPTATILTAGTYGSAAAGLKGLQLGRALPSVAAGMKGLSLAQQALQGAKTVAPIGAAFGGIQTLGQRDPITPEGAALNIGGGALGGALLGAATPLGVAAGKAGIQALSKNLPKLGQSISGALTPKSAVMPDFPTPKAYTDAQTLIAQGQAKLAQLDKAMGEGGYLGGTTPAKQPEELLSSKTYQEAQAMIAQGKAKLGRLSQAEAENQRLMPQATSLPKGVKAAEPAAAKVAASPTTEQVAAFKSADEFMNTYPSITKTLGKEEMTSMWKQAQATGSRAGSQAQLEKLWNSGKNEEALKVVKALPDSDPYKSQMLQLAQQKVKSLLGNESGAVDLNASIGGKQPKVGLAQRYKEVDSQITELNAALKDPNTANEGIRMQRDALREERQTILAGMKTASGAKLPAKAPATAQEKMRGLAQSAKEAPNLSAKTQAKIGANYTPKPNTQLMGEAKALLTDGAKIELKNIKNADQKVAATMQYALNLDKAGKHNEAAALFNNLSEQGTELGRGVQAFSMLKDMSPQSIALSAAGKIKKYNLTATAKIPELTGEQQKMISSQVGKIQRMAEGREKNIAVNELNRTISDMIPSSLADKAITVWKAGLLTSLRTHERNLLGNSIMQAGEIAKDPFATIADKIMAGKTGVRTQTTTLQGLREAGSKATRQQLKDLITRGYDPSETVSKYDVNHITWGKSPVQQGLKAYTEAVFRTLGAEDRAFHNSAFARSLYDQAGAAAVNAGKSGDKAFIEKLVKAPTDEMFKTATLDAKYATFHDKTLLSGLATNLKQVLQRQTGLKGEAAKTIGEVMAPFTGVPSSIVEKTFAYSPVGLVKGAINAGRVMSGQVPELQRQAAQEIGRGVVGSGLFGLSAYLMSKGLMTGQPKDAKEAAQWELDGKQANSILIGGQWRNINSIGPQNLVMLAGAKAQEELNKPDGSVGSYLAGLGKDQLSQTFLAGVQGPLQALNDPNRYGPSYLKSQASSVVPNIVKDTAKAFDNTQRETNSVADAFQASLPWFRNNLLPKRNALGEPIAQEPSGPAAYVDLFNSKTPISNPVVNELDRLYKSGNEATPSKLEKGQTVLGQKLTLTPAQLDQLEQSTGQPIRQQFSTLMSTPEYQGATDEMKKTALDNIVKQVRDQAKLGLTAGGSGSVNMSKVTRDAQLTLAKDAFDKSGKNYQVIGDTVLRRDAQGNISATPKVKFDYQVGTATLASQKNSGDFGGWMQTAQGQLDSISKQLADPSVDPLDALQLQNDATALRKSMLQYSQYNGFTKPKTGSSKLPKLATGTKIDMSNLKVNYKAPQVPKMPSTKIASILTPKSSAIKVTKGRAVAVKPQKIAIPKVPGFKGYA